MTIENKTPSVNLIEVGEHYHAEFGEIKKGSKASVKIEIKGENLKNLTVTKDCTCTKAIPSVIDSNTLEVELIYTKTNIVSVFNKSAHLNFTENNQPIKKTITLKGKITL